MTKDLEMVGGRNSQRWIRTVPILLCLWLQTPAVPVAAADPVVSNVVAAQRAGTKLVDITYDVSDTDGDDLTVSVQVSSDGGATYTVPAAHFSGDYGAGVRPGTGKKIVWDAAADWNQQYSQTMRFRVTANDGVGGAPAGMILIPAGNFQMGGVAGEGKGDEIPAHSVTLSAFYLDQYEVTKALWDEVKTWATANGYQFDNAGAGTAATHPVQTVSWYDVVKWLNARSEKQGRTPVYYTDAGQTVIYRTGQVNVAAGAVKWSANGYRLPTEAEWEYAARGGTTTRFYTGACISTNQANYNGNYPWTGCPTGQSRGATTAVGSFAANPWGLYDMAGNVMEWIWDWYGSYSSTAATNPQGSASGSYRVFRGGSWYNNANDLRSAYRTWYTPSDAGIYMGFRSALSQPAVPADMVLIPAGSFQMGDAIDGSSDAMLVHTVTLSAFYLDQYEVTKALWDEVKTWATANGYTFDNAGEGTAATHPVQHVSWYDVVKWLNARSAKEGRTPVYYTDSGQATVYRTGQVNVTAGAVKWTANGYRLPTEAEWEYAARAGTTTRFYTGSCIASDTEANYNGGYPWTGCPTGQYRGATTVVGSFPANPWGLYDMAGNVWEWTWDWYGAYSSTAVTNPQGPASGSYRVVRGGGWNYGADNLRSANRGNGPPSNTNYSMGFRSALSQP